MEEYALLVVSLPIFACIFVVAGVGLVLAVRAKKKQSWRRLTNYVMVTGILGIVLPVLAISSWYILVDYNDETVYAPSGAMAKSIYEDISWVGFQLDGVDYTFTDVDCDGTIMQDTDAPAANLAPFYQNDGERLLNILLSGKRHGINLKALYALPESGSGAALYYLYGEVYCPEDQLQQVQAWYADLTNYKTQLVYSLRKGGAEYTAQMLPHTFPSNMFAQLWDYRETETFAPVPCKGAVDEACLFAVSKDKIARLECWLIRTDGQIYITRTPPSSEDIYFNGIALPADLSAQLDAELFVSSGDNDV